MKKQNTAAIEEHLARAKAKDLPVSTKHLVEICSHIRYKNTSFAKKVLEDTMNLKRPIPFKKFKSDTGHKPGMAAGRFPQKAAKEMLKLIKAVETNAQFKGLNTANLKITKVLANKAAVPVTGGRSRTATKRTHVEIEVMETKEKKSRKNEKKETKTSPTKTQPKIKKEVPVATETTSSKKPEGELEK